MRKLTGDRVGLGWRPELAAGILTNLSDIDVVEVIADDYFNAPRSRVRALQSFSREVPITLHSIGLGLASTIPVESTRLDQMARLVETIRPESWSEHLAFVRAGGIEIGHLAAPPRNVATVDGASENLAHAIRRIGVVPAMENIATLIHPPGSTMDEPEWTGRILRETGSAVLLDLQNLYANSVNFRFDPLKFLDALDGVPIGAIHIAGGKWIRDSDRLLDDHLHDVPDPVYDLLSEVARRSNEPLTVILERDGSYPPMSELIAQLRRAREALAAGRRSRDLACV